MILYTYFRSSCSYRVRIALHYKGLEFESRTVNLKDGHQRQNEFLEVNPQGFVPYLVDGESKISQSMAILEYLEEVYPKHPLLPSDSGGRAQVRSIAQQIASDIQPIQNLRVLKHVTGELGLSQETRMGWGHHFIRSGFESLEKNLENTAGDYCFGNTLSLADLCLVPQVYNARRFNVDVESFPIIYDVNQRLEELGAFVKAHPDNQVDAPSEV